MQGIYGATFPGEALPPQTIKKESTEKQTHLNSVRSWWSCYRWHECSQQRQLPELFISINCLVHYPSVCVKSRHVVSLVSVGSACWFRPQKGRNMPSTFCIILSLVWCGVERGKSVQQQLYVTFHWLKPCPIIGNILQLLCLFFYFLQIFVSSFLTVSWT